MLQRAKIPEHIRPLHSSKGRSEQGAMIHQRLVDELGKLFIILIFKVVEIEHFKN